MHASPSSSSCGIFFGVLVSLTIADDLCDMHVVRAHLDSGYPVELHYPGHVPALCGRYLLEAALQNIAGE